MLTPPSSNTTGPVVPPPPEPLLPPPAPVSTKQVCVPVSQLKPAMQSKPVRHCTHCALLPLESQYGVPPSQASGSQLTAPPPPPPLCAEPPPRLLPPPPPPVAAWSCLQTPV